MFIVIDSSLRGTLHEIMCSSICIYMYMICVCDLAAESSSKRRGVSRSVAAASRVVTKEEGRVDVKVGWT